MVHRAVPALPAALPGQGPLSCLAAQDGRGLSPGDQVGDVSVAVEAEARERRRARAREGYRARSRDDTFFDDFRTIGEIGQSLSLFLAVNRLT